MTHFENVKEVSVEMYVNYIEETAKRFNLTPEKFIASPYFAISPWEWKNGKKLCKGWSEHTNQTRANIVWYAYNKVFASENIVIPQEVTDMIYTLYNNGKYLPNPVAMQISSDLYTITWSNDSVEIEGQEEIFIDHKSAVLTYIYSKFGCYPNKTYKF